MIRRIRIEAEETLQHLGTDVHRLDRYNGISCADGNQYAQVSQSVAHPLDTLVSSVHLAHIFLICIECVQ